MIELTDVSLNRQGKQILKDATMTINTGEIAVILGPSGAGKTSILKMILGLWHPDSGSVKIDGREIQNLSEKELLPIRRKMGIVFQGNALFDSLNVAENVGYFLNEQGLLSPAEIADKVATSLSFVNLSGTEKLYPEQLSGGMKKRVAIARALVFRPEIILYDEPTAGLDPINAKSILDLIKKLKGTSTTSVVVTHIINDAVSIGDILAVVDEGTIIQSGSVEEMVHSENQFVRDFFYEIFQDAELISKKKEKL